MDGWEMRNNMFPFKYLKLPATYVKKITVSATTIKMDEKKNGI
jgi:hypothetical protein